MGWRRCCAAGPAARGDWKAGALAVSEPALALDSAGRAGSLPPRRAAPRAWRVARACRPGRGCGSLVAVVRESRRGGLAQRRRAGGGGGLGACHVRAVPESPTGARAGTRRRAAPWPKASRMRGPNRSHRWRPPAGTSPHSRRAAPGDRERALCRAQRAPRKRASDRAGSAGDRRKAAYLARDLTLDRRVLVRRCSGVGGAVRRPSSRAS